MLPHLSTRKYRTITALLSITIVLAFVQLYYAASPIAPRNLYHKGIRLHQEHRLHRPSNGPSPEEELGWKRILYRPRRRPRYKVDKLVSQRTFLMLKTGGEVMWERLPVHFETTLKTFPQNAIYSDDAAKISNHIVIDILKDLPKDVIDNTQLASYRIRQQGLKENWGWDNSDIAGTSGWKNDKFKNIPMLIHAWRTAPATIDWFLMIDDDTYIITESFAALVGDKDPLDPWYIGSSAMISGRLFAHGGSGFIISRGALDMAFGKGTEEELDQLSDEYARKALAECCGDLMVGEMLRDVIDLNVNDGITYEVQRADPFQGNALNDTELKEDSWCETIASWHHVKPWEIALLHEWEFALGPHSRTDGVRQSDLYRDLLLPFMSSERPHWTIGAKGPKYSSNSDNKPPSNGNRTLSPHTSKEDCIQACELLDSCWGWEYEDGVSCTLEKDRLRRGKALNRLGTDWNEGQGAVYSGWMLERIRRMRAGKDCDPLDIDIDAQKYTDDDRTSEGWYFRLEALNDDEK